MQLKFPINIRFLHLLLLNTKRKKQIKSSWSLSHRISSTLHPLLFPSRGGSMRISEMFPLFLQHLFMLNYRQCASSKVKTNDWPTLLNFQGSRVESSGKLNWNLKDIKRYSFNYISQFVTSKKLKCQYTDNLG